jgi:uncharacterized membrane-anchored protein
MDWTRLAIAFGITLAIFVVIALVFLLVVYCPAVFIILSIIVIFTAIVNAIYYTLRWHFDEKDNQKPKRY